MAFYQLKREQIVKTSLDVLWDFISSPENLRKVTPDSMGFKITSGCLPKKLYAGLIIRYWLKPFPGYTTEWVTEITHIVSKKYFVDEQRVGPYAMWHHQHFLKEVNQGTKMTDIVSYVPPFGLLGRIAHSIVIEKQLNRIFDHREKIINKIFNS